MPSISFNSHLELTKRYPGAEDLCRQKSEAERIQIKGDAKIGDEIRKMNYLEIWNKKAPCKLNTKNSKTKRLENTVGCQAITHTVYIDGKKGTIIVGCKAVFY
ncbi:Hypothetical predicted protein [Paramuricea clavata]|uniref:Uncharacterized protein n=1 Tax=Paramuricea clavata TaxID=317549 RepID=A0A7D9D9U8_PARCT|nr:Hypothetical predicted protein [Paramuricea clavata]